MGRGRGLEVGVGPGGEGAEPRDGGALSGGRAWRRSGDRGKGKGETKEHLKGKDSRSWRKEEIQDTKSLLSGLIRRRWTPVERGDHLEGGRVWT